MEKLKIGTATIRSKNIDGEPYVCLNDFNKVVENARIANWLANYSTIEVLLAWEKVYETDFNYLEFQIIKDNARRINQLNISAGKWMELNGKALLTARGRQGGTWAHFDIALHYASWLDAEFNVQLNRAFRILLQQRFNLSKSELVWSMQRMLNNSDENTKLIQHLQKELDLPKQWRREDYFDKS
ncbi:MAG: KilA-N domain-containing protein [Saprospiraceae bacterium]